MDWEDEEFTPPPITTAVKSNWDDEEEEEEKPEEKPAEQNEAESSSAASNLPVRPKKAKKLAMKELEKAPESRIGPKEPLAGDKSEDGEDALARKLRLQRLQEAADYENTKAMFSGIIPEGEAVPKTEEEYESLAQTVGKQIAELESSFHYLAFLKTLLRAATGNLKSEELKDLAGLLTVLSNEKLKSEKTVKKKKAAPAKKSVNVDRDDENYDDAYDDGYDFM